MSGNKSKSPLRRTFHISTTEGIFAQAFMTLAGTGSVFITKFALVEGATPLHLGILAATGQVFLLFQPLGVFITRNLISRKGGIIRLFAIGRILPLLFGILPLIFPETVSLWLFLFLFFISVSLHALGTNAWTGWISDMVPLRIRGRFFALRSQFLMISGIVCGFFMGAFLDLFDEASSFLSSLIKPLLANGTFLEPTNLPFALAVIFCFASAMGLVSLIVLRRQPERPKEPDKESFRSFFITPLEDKNFRRLLLYGFWWMFAIGIGGPFWQPFMIEKLKMSIVEIQVYGTLCVVASVATYRAWGAMIDRFGNKPALRITVLLGGMNALLWLFVDPSGYRIVFFEALTAGIMYAGSGVVAMNFVLSLAPPGKGQIYSGLYAAVCGAGVISTMLLSGVFLPPSMHILGLSLESEQVLFGLTGLVRWSALIPLAFIVEPAAKPFARIFLHYRQFAKVRIIQLAMWTFRRRK